MDLFEYQAKSYISAYSIPVPRGQLATTVQQCRSAAKQIGLPVAVKAQVRSGSRGNAGGIKICHDEQQVLAAAESILAMTFDGETVESLWVEEAVDIADEYYASFTLDRSAKKHLLLFSRFGGVDIESVAETDPDSIIELHICPIDGFDYEHSLAAVTQSGVTDTAIAVRLAHTLVNLYDCYTNGDTDLAEVNPLVVTQTGDVIAVDAKVSLDSNAAFRHPEWQDFLASDSGDSSEAKAKAANLEYVSLEGNIGVIANGAGLAMSTIDVIANTGGSAANFCDIGGGSGSNSMATALEILGSDPKVETILVNVFGGITRCDNVAKGILDVLAEVEIDAPIVVRLDGTNALQAREILTSAETCGATLHIAETMDSAARLAIELANQRTKAGQDAADKAGETAACADNYSKTEL